MLAVFVAILLAFVAILLAFVAILLALISIAESKASKTDWTESPLTPEIAVTPILSAPESLSVVEERSPFV